MGEIVAIQYIKAEHLPAGMRMEKNFPRNGFIKKVIKFGSFKTEMTPISDPAEDILKNLGSLDLDFGSLELGDINDLKDY